MKRFIVLLLVILSACANAKWRQRYIEKKYKDFHLKYSLKNEYSVAFSCPGKIYKPIEQQTKREVKRSVECFESGIATIPDSISQHTNVIDSFYTNKNKIHFIKKHSLITEHKHLVQ